MIGRDYSIISLITVNLVAIFGVLFLNWSLFLVLLLYWMESFVIGFFTIIKMLISPTLPGDRIPLQKFSKTQKQILGIILKIFFIPFFVLHYGGFMIGHLIFVYGIGNMAQILENGGVLPGIFQMSDVIWQILIPFLVLFVSHGISFFINFIGKKEYQKTSSSELMIAPYKRIVVMHLTLLLGGFISAVVAIILQGISLNRIISATVMSLFIILKIYVDIKSHNKEHSKF